MSFCEVFKFIFLKFRSIRTFPAFQVCLLCGLLLLASGCAAPIKYDASVPQEIPAGFTGKINRQTISLELPELTLSAQIQAYDWDGQYLLKPLGVWLEVSPRNGWITLDPQQVRLKTDQGPDINALSFLGPSKSWESPGTLAAGCGPRGYGTGIGMTRIAVSQKSIIEADSASGIYRPSIGPVISQGKNCFMFWFDTDPVPEHEFLLSVDGIFIDGKNVTLPKIRFQKGSLLAPKGIPLTVPQ